MILPTLFSRFGLHNLPYPHLRDQQGVSGNETWQPLVPISQVRTDANFAVAAYSHSKQRLLDSRNDLPPSQFDLVIDERYAAIDSQHVARQSRRLPFIERHLIAAMQEQTTVVQNTIPPLRLRTFTFTLVEEYESLRMFHRD